MRKLSDYDGEEALDLWADLIEPIAVILTNEEVKKTIQKNSPPLLIVRTILKSCKKEATEILLRIDDTPVNGLNIISRLLALIDEIMHDKIAMSFFNSQGQKSEDEFSGSAMENTGANEI